MEITEELIDGKLVVRLVGKLDTVTSPDLQEKLMALVADDVKTIYLDFTNLSYVSSAGLRVLLMTQKRVKPLGGEVLLIAVNTSIKEVFRISGFNSLFNFLEALS